VGSPTPAGVHPHRWRVLSVLVVSLLIVVLDNTILNVALKTIQQDLASTQDELIWAINGYSLAFAALLFTWGVFGDRFGRKRVLVIGMAMFAVSSALCAFSRSPSELIVFRVLMGAFGACVLPVSLAIITVVFPPNERGRAIGLWSASVGGAVALGPIVGGVLLEHPQWFHWLIGNDWGSVFFINVPIVAIGLVGIIMVVPESKNPNPRRLDPQGLALSVVGLLALVYGIQKGDWGEWQTYLWIGLGLVVLTAFVWFESRTTHPSIDLALFKIRSFWVSLAGVSLSFGALQGTILFLAFYYQLVRGWSPLQSGLLTLPFAIGQIIAAPRSGKMVDLFGARKVIITGISITTVAMVMIAFTPQHAALWYLLLTGFLFGFGLGNVVAPATTRMTLATPPARSGSGAAVQNTVRQVGAAMGVAILSSVVGSVYRGQIRGVLAGSPLPPNLQATASDSIGATYEVAGRLAANGAPPAAVGRLQEAANEAFMPAFHAAAFVSAGLLIIAVVLFAGWLPVKPETVDWSATPSAPGEPAVDQLGAPLEQPAPADHPPGRRR
jgi:MFS transporter, DHA2 family, multidrug resistance protein